MQKIWIILKREYISRVRNKTFLISTIVSPILIVSVIGLISYFTAKSSDVATLLVADNTKEIAQHLVTDSSKVIFVNAANYKGDTSLQALQKAGIQAKVLISFDSIIKTPQVDIITKKSLGLFAEEYVRAQINKVVYRQSLLSNNVNPEIVDKLADQKLKINVRKLSEKNELVKDNAELARVIGYATGFLMYILVLVFGSQVMRGVSEEKTNRIAEVMVSSVKPFQLMMGKILGIGLVGLTGFVIWISISMAIQSLVLPMLMSKTAVQGAQSFNVTSGLGSMFQATNWVTIVSCFAFYFFGGYLFYAAMFAAIGSAVGEDVQEAQQLSFPVTLPILAAIVMLISALAEPNGSLATWASIMPFTSPIVMMGRVPFGVPSTVPYWQLFLSMGLLIVSIFLMTWLAGRIYRTGILMYGKKASWKEMMKWLVRG
jgi:ABC-2 type transport system permease protein